MFKTRCLANFFINLENCARFNALLLQKLFIQIISKCLILIVSLVSSYLTRFVIFSRRHQQHYHSQRRDSPRERHDRPVSNFYEYESVQAAMHSQQQQPHNQVHNQVQVQGGMPVSQHGHYGQMNTVAIQQQHLQHQSKRNNNNGITLPSPTVPLSMGVMRKQVSGSQFQAVPSFQQNQPVGRDTGRGGTSSNHTNNVCTFSGQSQSQRQTTQPNLHQNSLPRRHHKGNVYNNNRGTTQFHCVCFQIL